MALIFFVHIIFLYSIITRWHAIYLLGYLFIASLTRV